MQLKPNGPRPEIPLKSSQNKCWLTVELEIVTVDGLIVLSILSLTREAIAENQITHIPLTMVINNPLVHDHF